jgi:hypothetical protein
MATFDFASDYMSHLQEDSGVRRTFRSTLLGVAHLILEMIFWASELMPQWSDDERKLFKRNLLLLIAKDHRWGNANQNFLQTLCHLKSIEHTFAAIHELLDSESDSGSDECLSRGDNDIEGDDVSSDESADETFELIRDYREEDNEDITEPDEEWTLSIIQMILQLGADPNATDLHGATPLHLLAMNQSNLAQSNLLIENGAQIYQSDKSGSTPLMLFQDWQSQLASRGNPDPNLQSVISSALPLPLSCFARDSRPTALNKCNSIRR